MNHLAENRTRVTVSLCAAVALLLSLGITGAAMATPVTFNLNYETVGGAGTAVGTFTVDDTLLRPNVDIRSEDGLADLLCFQLTVSVPGAGTFIFTKADLYGWAFQTDAFGDFEDANFFMNCGSRQFIVDGFTYFSLGFYQCPQSEARIAAFVAHPEQGGTCGGAAEVPALDRTGLLALMLLVGVAAALALRRGAILG